jgi:hypothetical protein
VAVASASRADVGSGPEIMAASNDEVSEAIVFFGLVNNARGGGDIPR